MLRNINTLNGYSIRATDDEIGHVKDVYFDDEQWGLRYLVAETGSWLSKRPVLISPYCVTEIDDEEQCIHVSLTREQVKNSPNIDTHKPISRQLEHDYSRYYGYGNYWGGPYLWGVGRYPAYLTPGMGTAPSGQPINNRVEDQQVASAPVKPEDVHLRSCDKVSGYHILGTDDDIGHVKDFMFDDEDWAVRYLLVDTHNWWPGGKKVLLSTDWINSIDWSDSTVQTTLTQAQIKSSPEYDGDAPVNREYETRLFKSYGREGYWE